MLLVARPTLAERVTIAVGSAELMFPQIWSYFAASERTTAREASTARRRKATTTPTDTSTTVPGLSSKVVGSCDGLGNTTSSWTMEQA